MAVIDLQLVGIARRVKAQCERFDVFHNIDLKSDSEVLKLQVTHTMVELGLITGIPP
jgi:hypothetical protein